MWNDLFGTIRSKHNWFCRSTTNGMIINAVRNSCLYAARRFAQVTFKETLPDFSVTSCTPNFFSKYHFAAASSIPK